MRTITCDLIAETITGLCQTANFHLPDDLKNALARARQLESSATGQSVLDDLISNAELADCNSMPICQDTGMVVVFAEVGQDVHITGGSFEDAVNRGVASGYRSGCLRASVVADPLNRNNTGDNTPAVIHVTLVPGDRLRLIVAPKGFGSENMSAARLLKPSEGREGVRRFLLDTVEKAGPNPCPPVVVGVGIGGTLEQAAILAKRALLVPTGQDHPDRETARFEGELLDAVNHLGIGPGGLGGTQTALAVHILTYPTHIAGMPVVVNMSCHATRHAEAVL